MRPSTSRILYPLASLVLGALLFPGCDDGDNPEIEFRATPEAVHLEDLVLDPVPGKGGCEGCVTCFARGPGSGSGKICVRPDTRFVHTQLSATDDIQLTDGGLPLAWQLFAKSYTPLCSGQSCLGIGANQGPEGHTVIDIDNLIASKLSPTQLQFNTIGDQKWKEGPIVDLPQELGPTPPQGDAPGSAAPFVGRDPVTPALAHITYPAVSGGFRSCSGALVTERLVLTAAHCFIDSNNVTPLSKMWPLKLPPPTGLNVRLSGIHSPDHPTFPDGSVHTTITAIHLHPELSRDLALVELAAPSGLAPLSLNEPVGLGKSKPELIAYGYGVSGTPDSTDKKAYDWGRLKRTTLQEEHQLRARFAFPEQLMTFGAAINGIGVCRGDSGGPVIRKVGATYQLIAVMVARVAGMGPRVAFNDVELVGGRGFAFSRHNACGLDSPRAYVAVLLDCDVKQWIKGFLGGHPPAQCM